MQIRRQVLGDNHPDYARSLNNLAALYDSLGESAKAESNHLLALEVRRKILGDQHPDFAKSLNNLAHVYSSQQAYGKAEPLYETGDQVWKVLWRNRSGLRWRPAQPGETSILRKDNMTSGAAGEQAMSIRVRVLGAGIILTMPPVSSVAGGSMRHSRSTRRPSSGTDRQAQIWLAACGSIIPTTPGVFTASLDSS